MKISSIATICAIARSVQQHHIMKILEFFCAVYRRKNLKGKLLSLMATMEITNPPPGEGGVSVSVEKINPRNRFELIDPQIQHEFIKNL
ncbi:hypothetical protein C5167_050777, partial [Papaver somniferum]